MNRHIIFILLILITVNVVTYAQSNINVSDSISIALRLKTLRSQKERLQEEIREQDTKRNKQIVGVSAKTLEYMNNKQDSICLELRSALTDVNLEIKELMTITVTPQLMNQINSIIKSQNRSKPKEEYFSESKQPVSTEKVKSNLIQ